MSGWISTLDSFPKDYETVIICIDAGGPMQMVTDGWIDPIDKCWRSGHGKVNGIVTHWMPMPDAPDNN
jgi:hypothetical protein